MRRRSVWTSARLLQAINAVRRTGSIPAAAREMGITYRSLDGALTNAGLRATAIKSGATLPVDDSGDDFEIDIDDSATIPPRPNDGVFQMKDSVPILSRTAAPPFPEGVGVAYEKRVAVTAAPGTTVIVGDMHLPWWHRPTIDAILSLIEKIQPAAVVQVGDLYDMFSHSKFPKRLFITPQDELDQAREKAEFWWSEVHRRAPGASLHQRRGNHDVRAEKRILESCPEIHGLAMGAISDLYRFEHVATVMDTRDDVMVGGALIQHGDEINSRVPGRRALDAGMCVVCGHTHRAWIIYVPTRAGLIWEACAGHVADPQAEPLRYTPTKYNGWQRGVTMVTNGVPSFIPL